MELRQIQKRTAKKLYNEGKKLYLLPCKVDLHSSWIKPAELSDNSENTWDSAINSFCYYNCNNELGKYPHFYVKLD